jgi:hypothetical protein
MFFFKSSTDCFSSYGGFFTTKFTWVYGEYSRIYSICILVTSASAVGNQGSRVYLLGLVLKLTSARSLAFLCLSFLICKNVHTVYASLDRGRDYIVMGREHGCLPR